MSIGSLRFACVAVVLAAVAPLCLAQEFQEGIWTLEIERHDAPKDIRKLVISGAQGIYTVASSTGSSTDSPIVNFRIVDNAVSFDFQSIALSCRLQPQSDAQRKWLGICPPDADPGSADSVTVLLRNPEGPEMSDEASDSAPQPEVASDSPPATNSDAESAQVSNAAADGTTEVVPASKEKEDDAIDQ